MTCNSDRAITNGVDSRKEIGQGVQELYHKQKPSNIDVLSVQGSSNGSSGYTAFPSHSCPGTLCCLMCLRSAAGEVHSAPQHPVSLGCSEQLWSGRKERVRSWNSEEGLGSVTGLKVGRIQKRCGGRSSGMAAWALADCHPPGGEHRSFPAKSQGLWLPGELLASSWKLYWEN